MAKEYLLKKDIVIPAGTRLLPPAKKTIIVQSKEAVAAIVELTRDTYGEMIYYFDPHLDRIQWEILKQFFPEEILLRAGMKEVENEEKA